ncbi:hypothetical protein JOB18_025980 [Solea senegalensis]|uniref:Uncharacterized protein n=1 Tax=Solea senegalensis TaxID=28829 RepID=A0AAV6QRB2_SOLSE|nr:hypothetical protein JOB18_025980 [Solea senegalensis]
MDSQPSCQLQEFREDKRRWWQIIGGAAVEMVTTYKFLGVHISSDLTGTMDTAGIIKKAHQCLLLCGREEAIDQAHEQGNAIVKGDGAFRINEDLLSRTCEDVRHHEQTDQSQKSFTDKVQKVFGIMKDLGNPRGKADESFLYKPVKKNKAKFFGQDAGSGTGDKKECCHLQLFKSA